MRIDEHVFSWAVQILAWFEKDLYFPARPDFDDDGLGFVVGSTETINDEDYEIIITVRKLDPKERSP